MPQQLRFKQNEKKLIRRYLVWCYKTTKESLDRIDRKFTQLQVDEFVFHKLQALKGLSHTETNRRYKNLINNFELYMKNKEDEAKKQKYWEGDSVVLNPEYVYLVHRLKAIEQAICHFLSSSELKKIEKSFEEEMTHRIWEAKEHN